MWAAHVYMTVHEMGPFRCLHVISFVLLWANSSSLTMALHLHHGAIWAQGLAAIPLRKIMWAHMTVLCSSPLLLWAVLAPPSLSYKSVTLGSRDHGNLSHNHTRDSSHDPSASTLSRDRMACDPGNLRPRDPGNLWPCDPGKITHDLSRNWSSTMSHDKMRF